VALARSGLGAALSAPREPPTTPGHAVTKSLCGRRGSSCGRDVRASIVLAMDVVAIVLGILMFAILLLIIEGIDRV
jgi:hypothetical protein